MEKKGLPIVIGTDDELLHSEMAGELRFQIAGKGYLEANKQKPDQLPIGVTPPGYDDIGRSYERWVISSKPWPIIS